MATKKKSTRSKATTRKVSRPKAAKKIPAPHPSHHAAPRRDRSGVSLLIAVLGLLVNVIIPGLGSIMSKRVFSGVWQLLLFIIGFSLTSFLAGGAVVGFLIWFVAILWAAITSILVIKNAV